MKVGKKRSDEIKEVVLQNNDHFHFNADELILFQTTEL